MCSYEAGMWDWKTGLIAHGSMLLDQIFLPQMFSCILAPTMPRCKNPGLGVKK